MDYKKPQPCGKFVREDSLPSQMKHIGGEVSEAWVELANLYSTRADYGRVMFRDALAEELTDVICACTTALAMLGLDEAARDKMVEKVNHKNQRRGYWEE